VGERPYKALVQLIECLASAKREGNTATKSSALKRTKQPGVYRKANRYVAVYRVDGRQRKEYAATFDEARAIKLTRDAQSREQRRGVMLHSYVLSWAEGHSGSGHDSVSQLTREEYRRLLVTYVLRYFDRDIRLEDLSHRTLQGFIGWLTHCPGRNGNLADRSVRNALTPLRLSLEAAAAEGHVDPEIVRALVLPKRRGGRRRQASERKFLTRSQLGRLLDEIPTEHAPLLLLLASTGLRISEAIALRWTDLDLDCTPPRLYVRRTIVKNILGAPKSRYGARTIPLSEELAERLKTLRPQGAEDESLVFQNSDARHLDPQSLRKHVVAPTAERIGLQGIGLHTLRHTCASLLIAEGANMLRLQRWMGHHSPAYTLETYGHLIDGELGSALELANLKNADAVPSG
jgi:integrase